MGKRALNPRVFVDGVKVGSLIPPRPGVTEFWWFRWTPPSGHMQRMSTEKTTEPDARAVAEAYHRGRAEELIATVPGAGASKVGRASTLGEFGELFIKDKYKEDGTGDWRDGTVRKHTDITRAFISFLGKDRPLSAFNRDAVKQWLEYDRTRPKKNGKGKQSPSSVKSNLGIVKSFGNWLWEEEFIPAPIRFKKLSPNADAIRRTRKQKSHPAADVAKIARHLMNAKNNYLRNSDAAYWFDMFRIGVGMGTRPAELVNLRACDFNPDLNGGLIKVQEYDDHGVKTEDSIRDIWLKDLAPEVLEALKRRAKEAQKLGHTLLFGKFSRGRNRERVDVAWNPDALRVAYQRAIEGCGTHSFPYSWRHCFVRRATAAGWRVEKIMEFTGHTQRDTTDNYGQEVTAAELKPRDILPGVFEGALELVPATEEAATA